MLLNEFKELAKSTEVLLRGHSFYNDLPENLSKFFFYGSGSILEDTCYIKTISDIYDNWKAIKQSDGEDPSHEELLKIVKEVTELEFDSLNEHVIEITDLKRGDGEYNKYFNIARATSINEFIEVINDFMKLNEWKMEFEVAAAQ